LHLDTAHLLSEKDLSDERDKTCFYRLEAKCRPCLIVEVGQRGYFLVWFTTGRYEKGHRRLVGVTGLKGESYLRPDPHDITWIHKKLAGNWIGAQDPLAFHDL